MELLVHVQAILQLLEFLLVAYGLRSYLSWVEVCLSLSVEHFRNLLLHFVFLAVRKCISLVLADESCTCFSLLDSLQL
jgi:hypothetical protein